MNLREWLPYWISRRNPAYPLWLLTLGWFSLASKSGGKAASQGALPPCPSVQFCQFSLGAQLLHSALFGLLCFIAGPWKEVLSPPASLCSIDAIEGLARELLLYHIIIIVNFMQLLSRYEISLGHRVTNTQSVITKNKKNPCILRVLAKIKFKTKMSGKKICKIRFSMQF